MKDGVLTQEMLEECVAKTAAQGHKLTQVVLAPVQYDKAAYMVHCNFKNWAQFEVPALVDFYWSEFATAMPEAYAKFQPRKW